MRFIKKNYRLLCGVFLLVIFFCWNGFLNSSTNKTLAKSKPDAPVTASDAGVTASGSADTSAAQTDNSSLTASNEQEVKTNEPDISAQVSDTSDIAQSASADITDNSEDDIDSTITDPEQTASADSSTDENLVEPMGPLDSYGPDALNGDGETDASAVDTSDTETVDTTVDTDTPAETPSDTENTTDTEPDASTEAPAEQGYVHIETAVSDRPAFDYCIADVSNSLNVRQGPSTGYAVAGKMHSNSWAAVLEYGDEWSKVSSNGIVGYAYNAYLLTKDAALNKIRSLGALYIKVFTNVLNVRTEPNTDCRIIKRLTDGDKYPYLPEYSNKEWFAIKLEDGEIGYISTAYSSIYIDLDGISQN